MFTYGNEDPMENLKFINGISDFHLKRGFSIVDPLVTWVENDENGAKVYFLVS